MKIFIVNGCTGDYDSYKSWIVKAYKSEYLANHHVKQASARAYEVVCNILGIPYTTDRALIHREINYSYCALLDALDQEGVNEWDPNMFFVDGWIRYYVIQTELDDNF